MRDVAAALTRAAKDAGIPLLLVGHVTKDGSVAGPRLLEHLVDVVAHFDGDRQTALRFVRASKNRSTKGAVSSCWLGTQNPSASAYNS